MLKRKVYFGNPETALKFITQVAPTTAIMKIVNGSNVINAKSILGLFSLDLTTPHILEIRGENSNEEKVLDTMIQEYLSN